MRARAAAAKQVRKWCTNPKCKVPGVGNGAVCRTGCDCACHVVDVRYLALDVEYLASEVERQAHDIATLRRELAKEHS
jgi:hypothetical protein